MLFWMLSYQSSSLVENCLSDWNFGYLYVGLLFLAFHLDWSIVYQFLLAYILLFTDEDLGSRTLRLGWAYFTPRGWHFDFSLKWILNYISFLEEFLRFLVQLQVSREVMLRLHINGTYRAHWDDRMGFCKNYFSVSSFGGVDPFLLFYLNAYGAWSSNLFVQATVLALP